MYDTSMESLKKAAISARVRNYLVNQEMDPADLTDNPELSLDLQNLIDDPNFDVNEGLFPELFHDKLSSQNQLLQQQQQQQQHHISISNGHNNNNNNNNNQGLIRSHHQNQIQNQNQHIQNQIQNQNYSRNPLAYMPQPVHGGSSFTPGSANSSPGSSPIHESSQNHHPHIVSLVVNGGVKIDPDQLHNNVNNNNNNTNNNHSQRLDFNANTVSSSSDPGYSSYSSNNLTSPSSASSSSSSSSTSSVGGGGGGAGGSGNGPGYSPNGYNGTMMMDHLGVLNGGSNNGGNVLGGIIKASGSHGGGGLTFNPGSLKGLHGHSNHGHHGGGHLSKKQKNVDKASDEYKRRRERNNVAVRKSREKAKMRSRETEERVKILAKENERLQKKIDLLTEELTFLRSFFSNVGGLPEQIHREFNKHLETFQHHHIQNGIQFPSFASFKSMQ